MAIASEFSGARPRPRRQVSRAATGGAQETADPQASGHPQPDFKLVRGAVD
jgi:hypothetical protein